MFTDAKEKISLFFSYAHEDETLRNELEKHLRILQRQGMITNWHDRRIGAGDEWKDKIDEQLNNANIILLLISPDFLDSDYCYDIEMKRALERHEIGEARVIPIILRPVEWKGTPFDKLLALPKDGVPVVSWVNQDEAFVDVAGGIRRVVEEFRKEKKETVVYASVGQKSSRKTLQKSASIADLAYKYSRQGLTIEQTDFISNLREEFKDTERRKFTFLLVGRMGVGKSSTINSLLGKKVAKVGRQKKVTRKISRHEGEIEGIRYSIVDTPGLADPDIEKDRIYLNEIKRTIKRIDCMWYVSPLPENRIENDTNVIKLICEIFGKEIWKRAIIVFTFADFVKSAKFLARLEERSNLVRNEIVEYTGTRIAKSIPAVAVCNDEDSQSPVPLPNGELWLGELYVKVLSRISREAALPFIFATRNRITNSKPSRSVRTRSKQIYIPPNNTFWDTVGKILVTGIDVGFRYYVRRGPSGTKEDIAKIKDLVTSIMKKG